MLHSFFIFPLDLLCYLSYNMIVHYLKKEFDVMELLFPKEEEIMYTIWQIGHPCVISEILKENPSLKRNTVAKVISILKEKGYIAEDSIVKTRTRTGRSYRARIKKADYESQKELLNTIVENPNVENGILQYCNTLINTKECDIDFINNLEKMIHNFKSTEE